MIDFIVTLVFLYALGVFGFGAYDWYTLKVAGINSPFWENVQENINWIPRLLKMFAQK